VDVNEQRRHLERIRTEARDLLDSDPLVDAEVRRSAQRIVEAAQLVLDGIGRSSMPKIRIEESGVRDAPREGSVEAVQYQKGLAAFESGELEVAEVAFRESVRLDAMNIAPLFLLARTLLANPRYERAGTLPVVRSLLDRAVAIAPEHADVRALHDKIVREMGQ
jgi:hypothetical protein